MLKLSLRYFRIDSIGKVGLIFILANCQPKSQPHNFGINPDAIKIDVIVPEHGMADPHAWVLNDTLWVICGHDASWDPKSSFPMDRWEVWSSVNLKDWNYHRSILPTDTYIGDQPNCWAGDITERDGKYYWFFSNRHTDTGVMIADQIDGEYKDLLGKPLLPKGIVPVSPYDPEIYLEDGIYTICFGAGTYYMATLSEDMKSLATEPKAVLVKDKSGKKMGTGDKSTLFKRNDWYYLVWGDNYAMSNNLYGPYDFKGAFLSGGHTSFFEWSDGQLYVLQENHDISAFYRGASLKPVFFNEDQTILVPEDDRWYPAPGRPFAFKNSTMGWRSPDSTATVNFSDGKLKGVVSSTNAIIQSAPWLYTDSRLCSEVIFKVKNSSDATEMKFAMHTRNQERGFWRIGTAPINWDEKEWITIPIEPNQENFITYSLPISAFEQVNERIMQIALQPLADVATGEWELEEIIIK
ncbi:MAG: family 43 glycosylhydrolase [Bacteroidota bacterium]